MTDTKKPPMVKAARNFLAAMESPPTKHSDRNIKLAGLVSVMLLFASGLEDGAEQVTVSPALSQLATLLHCSDRTVKRELARLRALRLISSQKRGRLSNQYTIHKAGQYVAPQEAGQHVASQKVNEGTPSPFCGDTSTKKGELRGHLAPFVGTPIVHLWDSPLDKPSLDKPPLDKPPLAPQHGFAVPDWVPSESWLGFLEMRKRLRKPLTERATRLTIGKLEKFRAAGQDVGGILDQSVERGWTGVFPLKEAGAGKPSRHANFSQIDYTAGLEENGDGTYRMSGA